MNALNEIRTESGQVVLNEAQEALAMGMATAELLLDPGVKEERLGALQEKCRAQVLRMVKALHGFSATLEEKPPLGIENAPCIVSIEVP